VKEIQDQVAEIRGIPAGEPVKPTVLDKAGLAKLLGGLLDAELQSPKFAGQYRALVLMELNVFQALSHVLGLYSNIAIAWIMTVVADLVINKPLGLSPPGIEFRRAHLYDINPVGVGAMGVASVLSVAAHLGAFGPLAQAFSAMIALVTALLVSPLIAWATGGRYYLARRTQAARAVAAADLAQHGASLGQGLGADPSGQGMDADPSGQGMGADPSGQGLGADPLGRRALRRCTICERDYEPEDMAACPAYGGLICSLCCTLDARCDDLCKPQARLSAQWLRLLQRLSPARMAPQLESGLSAYLLLMAGVLPALALLLLGLYALGLRSLSGLDAISAAAVAPLLRAGVGQIFAVLLLIAGMVAWWAVLAQRGRQVAQEESRRQTQALNEQAGALREQAAVSREQAAVLQAQALTLQDQALALGQEIRSHQQTDAQLQLAKAQADAANQAKSRYITAISHELRTPLNSILGYAQLLEDDPAIPPHRRGAVQVIRRGGDHLLSLIEGTLDIARIESGRLALEPAPMHFAEGVDELARWFEPQAAARGLRFVHSVSGTLPDLVRADEKRLRQILINLLGNALKFTRVGQVRFRVDYAREMARFEIEDTGPGMAEAELAQVFEPFVRGTAAGGNATSGTGLGLTIARMLTGLMGGELTVRSTPGVGSCFTVRLYLPELRARASQRARPLAQRRTGYSGPRRRLLVVDNEEADRRLLVDRLAPLGFELLQADSGEAALALLHGGGGQPVVDAVFLDLAMPGIDGWTTLRRLREQGFAHLPAAIVSANAFDQGLENELGISAADFLVKPVRMNELLDWLQRRLALQWIDEAERAPDDTAASLAAQVVPPAQSLRALDELVRLGYLRGIQKKLDAIDAEHPASADFIHRLRTLARGFQLDTLAQLIAAALQPAAVSSADPADPAAASAQAAAANRALPDAD
jgi:signal transduction histidine kinase/FixJ family two-component response regulator